MNTPVTQPAPPPNRATVQLDRLALAFAAADRAARQGAVYHHVNPGRFSRGAVLALVRIRMDCRRAWLHAQARQYEGWVPVLLERAPALTLRLARAA